jgi:hypothetical protein
VNRRWRSGPPGAATSRRRRGAALHRRDGIGEPLTAAVSVTQRFGQRVSLNAHHHLVLTEGVFREDEEGRVGFRVLRRPTREELQAMGERIVRKTAALARRRGLLEEEPHDALSKVQADALQTGLPVAAAPPVRPPASAGDRSGAWGEGGAGAVVFSAP